MKAAFYTLGCKLNQTETEAVASAFRDAGFDAVALHEDAEIYLINTCTVTTKGEQKARRVIRKILRERPGVPVIVTGCYAQMDPGDVSALGDRVILVSLDHKDILLDLPAGIRAALSSDPSVSCAVPRERESLYELVLDFVSGKLEDRGVLPRNRFRFNVAALSFHTRPALKIQDGCDNRCSYCRVTLARGASVSLELSEVIERVQSLEAAGHEEVVLTGVNISSYRSGNAGLADLLEKLISSSGRIRFRLSSIEPDSVDERFADVAAHPRICPHFHLPVQSGSDAVLKAMRRRYLSDGVRRAVNLLRNSVDDPFFAADVITGFPGETADDFAGTVNLLTELDFAYLHVFPYSPRPGTAAASFRNPVAESLSRERAGELEEISRKASLRYAERRIGKPCSLLLETRLSLDGLPGWQGTSEHYQKIIVHESDFSAEHQKGTLVRCIPTRLLESGILLAKIEKNREIL